MESANVKRFGDTWQLIWHEHRVGMVFERVHEEREGLWSLVTVSSQHPERQGRIHGPHRLNLWAAQSQSSFAKELESRLHLEEWKNMLVDGCALVAKQWSEPSPSVYTDEIQPDLAQLECLVPGPGGIPLIPMDETTFVYGDSESLKSFLCQVIVSCVHQGVALPWGEMPKRQLRVLYLDWETNDVVIADRMARIAQGLSIAPIHMAYRGYLRTRDASPLRMLHDEVANIREQIQREQIGLVVVDSIGFAVAGKLVDDDVARGAMAALRQLPATRLVVAHISKESAHQPNGRVDPFGSTFFRAGLRSGFEVRRSELQPLDGAVDLAIYHWKSNDGEHVKPFGLRVGFDGQRGAVSVMTQPLSDMPDLSSRTPVLARLQAALRGGDTTIYEAAEEVGESAELVGKTFRRYRDKLFVQTDTGGPGKPARWGLSS